jgi:transcriptional regulator with XRE-family HTH domain
MGLGNWLRDLRVAAGLTQEELAARTGMDWPTGIASIESGHGSLPPEYLLAYADALGQNPRIFAARVLRFTHPHAFALLLGEDPRQAFREVIEALPGRGVRRPLGASLDTGTGAESA